MRKRNHAYKNALSHTKWAVPGFALSQNFRLDPHRPATQISRSVLASLTVSLYYGSGRLSAESGASFLFEMLCGLSSRWRSLYVCGEGIGTLLADRLSGHPDLRG